MHIVHVVHGYPPAIGGTEMVMRKILEKLAARSRATCRLNACSVAEGRTRESACPDDRAVAICLKENYREGMP